MRSEDTVFWESNVPHIINPNDPEQTLWFHDETLLSSEGIKDAERLTTDLNLGTPDVVLISTAKRVKQCTYHSLEREGATAFDPQAGNPSEGTDSGLILMSDKPDIPYKRFKVRDRRVPRSY